ncbi:V protein [avian paramyxovirus 11]|uniref:V protein n=1 Tax=avian paramyxovirus 11 TaxID=2560310 RepID=I6V328_9MONO|nr:V protein [Avian paramyxovirus 11]AFN06860.1 V protein [Avian paramyxovirus 11]
MRAKGIGSRDPPRHWHFIMDFTNDEEISDLLNQSERVITEIQRASQQPKSTVGKSAIPRGNTSNLTQAWESESSSTAEMGPISSLSTAKNANSEPTLKSGTAQPEGHQSQNPSSLPHIDDTITKEQPIDESVIKSQIKEGAIGTQLDRFLDKTASRMKAESGFKKGVDQYSTESGEEQIEPDTDAGYDSDHSRASRGSASVQYRTPVWTINQHDSIIKSLPGIGRVGHRREYILRSEGNQYIVESWCNPKCAPIRANPIREQCRCGYCPRACTMCYP